ncbi:MAG: hypothetical protein VKP62_00175 [Candidatus Sericytochromatia bacterium]|nr:hypothetical protein [Candidatus Sericytochromatia bacterium]
MTQWTQRVAGWLALASLVACDHLPPPAGVAPGGSSSPVPHAGVGPTEGPPGVPVLFNSVPWVVTPPPVITGPVLVGGNPTSGGAPIARTPPPASTPSPSPSPTPTPTPEPQVLEFDAFLVRVPHPWRVALKQTEPIALQLVPGAGVGGLRVAVEEAGDTRLESRQAEARGLAGDGYLAQAALTLDEVRGFQINSNRDGAEGKRYVIERGFIYRSRYWRIVSEWDKRTPEAGAIERDVTAILKTWRWL